MKCECGIELDYTIDNKCPLCDHLLSDATQQRLKKLIEKETEMEKGGE
jgi:hypothetical protein